jgi:hypothetical protein
LFVAYGTETTYISEDGTTSVIYSHDGLEENHVQFGRGETSGGAAHGDENVPNEEISKLLEEVCKRHERRSQAEDQHTRMNEGYVKVSSRYITPNLL